MVPRAFLGAGAALLLAVFAALAQEGSESLEKEARRAFNQGQFKKAALKFETSAAAAPGGLRRSKMLLQAAWSHFNDRRPDAARDALRRGLQVTPDLEIVPEFFSPDFMKLVQDVRASNRAAPPSLPAPASDIAETKRIAREKLADGHAEDVVHDLTYNVPRERLDAEALALLASAYDKLGRYGDASKARAEAAAWKPVPAPAPSVAIAPGDLLAVGQAALARGDVLNAQAAANRLLETDPTSSEAYRLLGESFLARGEKLIGEANLKQSLKYNEKNVATLLVLYQYSLGEKNWDAALDALKKATELDPENREKLVALGRRARADGDLLHARQTFAAAAAVLPKDASLLTEYATVLLQMKDVDGALDPLMKAAMAEPGLAIARANLAVGLRRKGLIKEAEREYREALRADPEYLPALIGLGGSLLERQAGTEAIEYLRKAVARDPLSVEAALLLGRALRITGNHAAATEVLHKAKDLGSAEIWNEAGAVAYERGRYGEAFEWFERASGKEPDVTAYKANREKASRLVRFVEEAGVTPMAASR